MKKFNIVLVSLKCAIRCSDYNCSNVSFINLSLSKTEVVIIVSAYILATPDTAQVHILRVGVDFMNNPGIFHTNGFFII